MIPCVRVLLITSKIFAYIRQFESVQSLQGEKMLEYFISF